MDRVAVATAPGMADRRETVFCAVREGSEPSSVFWLMNALATVIACYWLFANSPAVVIGAMVVAMMLGPIAGVALGLNDSDRPLLKTSLLSLVGGIGWILAIALVVGFIHRDLPLTDEIRFRTGPRLFDLIIALAGGAAGAVAVLSPKVGTAIVGVAVATVLVPPQAAAGVLFARGDFDLAGGALLLTATNIVAIQVAVSIVFWAGGYRRLTAIGGRGLLTFLRREGLSPGLVCLLATLLGFQLHRAVARSLFESNVRAVLHRRFEDDAKYHLVGVRFASEGDTTIVRAVVRGPKPPVAGEVAAAQAALPPPPNGGKQQLYVRSSSSRRTGRLLPETIATSDPSNALGELR